MYVNLFEGDKNMSSSYDSEKSPGRYSRSKSKTTKTTTMDDFFHMIKGKSLNAAINHTLYVEQLLLSSKKKSLTLGSGNPND